MKKLLALIFLVSSMSAFADDSQCKEFYANHFQRINLISSLFLSEKISSEFQQARLADEDELMSALTPVMCPMSFVKRTKLKNEALAELHAN